MKVKKKDNIWEIFWMLTKTDFELRYHGSYLGFFWTLLKPLLIFIVLFLVFSTLFANSEQFFAVRLLTGLILWNFFTEATMVGMGSLLNKSNLLKKIYFPRWVVVVSSFSSSTLGFLINILILFAIMLFSGVPFNIIYILNFFVYIIELFLLIIGFSLATSVLFPKFRDLNQIWEVILNALFFATPIIYPLSIIPGYIQSFLFLNPMTFIIQYSKQTLIDNTFASITGNIVILVISITALVLGILIFKWLNPRITEDL